MFFTSTLPGYFQFYQPHLHVFLHQQHQDIFSFINLTYICFTSTTPRYLQVNQPHMCFTSTTPGYLQFYQPHLHVLLHQQHQDIFSFINLTYMCFSSTLPGYLQFYQPHLHVFNINSTRISSVLSTVDYFFTLYTERYLDLTKLKVFTDNKSDVA